MREREFQHTVIQAAEMYGWKVAHFGNTVKIVRRGSDYKTIPDKQAAGFPDLVLVKGRTLVFAELKGDGGSLSSSQRAWLDALRGLQNENVLVCTWYPKDWPTIEEVLSGR